MRLAFGFRAGSGKDHASEYFRSKFGGHNLKFAAPLKELATQIQEFVGFPVEKDRELLQWLGTDFCRARDETVWIRMMEEKIRTTPPAHLYVSDVRFPNEAESLKNMGFLLVRLDRDAGGTAGWTQHQSENAMDNYEGWDFIVKNCGHLSHFESQLDILWQHAKEAGDLINRQTLEIR